MPSKKSMKKATKKTMKTKRKKWIIGGKFDEAKLDADLDSIISEYGNIGRLEAEIQQETLELTWTVFAFSHSNSAARQSLQSLRMEVSLHVDF